MHISCPYCRQRYDCYLENTQMGSMSPQSIKDYTSIKKNQNMPDGFIFIFRNKFPVYKVFTKNFKNYIYVTHFLYYLILHNKFKPEEISTLKNATDNIVIYNSDQKIKGTFGFEESLFYIEGAVRLLRRLRPTTRPSMNIYNYLNKFIHDNITHTQKYWVTIMFAAVYSLQIKCPHYNLQEFTFNQLNSHIDNRLNRILFYKSIEKMMS